MRLSYSFDFTFEVPLGLFKISDDIHTAVAVATCDTFDRAAQVEVNRAMMSQISAILACHFSLWI